MCSELAQLGLVSLTFRQTNVVWLGFVMASTVVDALERLPPKSSPAKTTRPRLAREYQNFGQCDLSIKPDSTCCLTLLPALSPAADFLGSTFRLSHKALADPRRILFPFVLPYFPTFLAFLTAHMVTTRRDEVMMICLGPPNAS